MRSVLGARSAVRLGIERKAWPGQTLLLRTSVLQAKGSAGHFCSNDKVVWSRCLNTTKNGEIGVEKKKTQALKQKISKEKNALNGLKKKLEETSKKHKLKAKERETKEKQRLKSQREREKAKKLKVEAKRKQEKFIAKATKPFRRLSAYNYFVKQSTDSSKGLERASNAWKVLTEEERGGFQKKADEYNEKMLAIYVPKPRAPPSSYASFVKENFPSDNTTFRDANVMLASRWRSLTPEEKVKYEPSKQLKEEYQRKLASWKQQRIKAYEEHGEKL